MPQPKILAFAGSTRKQSFNKKLVCVAADLARQNGAKVTVIDLNDFPLPLFDEDLEASQGFPQNADKLFELFKSHDALLLSSPEYNSSISAVLKNAIDWVSRPRPDEIRMAAFVNKIATLLSASPGQLGGLRGLVHVRSILSSIGVLVLPDQLTLSNAHEAFAEDGLLIDKQTHNRLASAVNNLVSITRRLKAESCDT